MRRPVRLVASVLVTTMLLAAGCGDDDTPSPPDPNERLTDIYAAAIEAIAADATDLPGEDDDPLTVFVAEHEEAEISADVQVGVVAALESWATVRFIDSLDEAVDRDEDGAPVRGEGILVGLGEVGDGEATATLVADRYEGEGTTVVYDLELTRRGGEWTVETPLDGVAVDAP